MISGTGSPNEAIEDIKARRETVLSIPRLSLPVVRRIAVLAAIVMIVGFVSVVAHAAPTVDQPDPIATPSSGDGRIDRYGRGGQQRRGRRGGWARVRVRRATADAAGNWSCSILFLMDGTFTFTVTELDSESEPVASETRTVLVNPRLRLPRTSTDRPAVPAGRWKSSRSRHASQVEPAVQVPADARSQTHPCKTRRDTKPCSTVAASDIHVTTAPELPIGARHDGSIGDTRSMELELKGGVANVGAVTACGRACSSPLERGYANDPPAPASPRRRGLRRCSDPRWCRSGRQGAAAVHWR